MFSPYTTTHDSFHEARMGDRHFREARVDPGSIPQVNLSPEIRVPDTRNVKESTTDFAQPHSLSQVWDLARATGIAKAVYLRFLIILTETFGEHCYEKLKKRHGLSAIINETVIP